MSCELSNAAQQHRYVRSLPTPVDVQLVGDQELELLHRLLYERTLVRAQEHVLEHHVVREQEVRRLAYDRVAGLVFVLRGVAREGDRAVGPVLVAERAQRLDLAIDKGVHREDGDCPD